MCFLKNLRQVGGGGGLFWGVPTYPQKVPTYRPPSYLSARYETVVRGLLRDRGLRYFFRMMSSRMRKERKEREKKRPSLLYTGSSYNWNTAGERQKGKTRGYLDPHSSPKEAESLLGGLSKGPING